MSIKWIGVIVTMIGLCLTTLYGHSHDDNHETAMKQAKYKYSREANQPATDAAEQKYMNGLDEHLLRYGDGYDHDHEHDNGHIHGHSHEEHGHSHGGHGHSHVDHGHSHGGHGHSHEGHGHYHGGHVHSHAGHDHSHGGHGHSHGEHGHSHSGHDDSHNEHFDFEKYKQDHNWGSSDEISSPKISFFSLWIKALLSTAIISASPVLILFLIPLENSKQHESLLKVLLSFASGGLLGDAFLHLIPHAALGAADSSSTSHSTSHGHSHSHGSCSLRVGMWVLFGIIAFLIVEKLVRFLKGGHGHSHTHSISNHTSHSIDSGDKNAGDNESHVKSEDASADVTNTTENLSPVDNEEKVEKVVDNEDKEQDAKSDETSDGQVSSSNEKDQTANDKHEICADAGMKVSGYLNLAADFAHNFTDGLAIGASYLAGTNIGIITTITIFLHEIPHEIGDFAILVQSGCSKKQAMLLQFSTAIGAMIGTVCSLLAGGIGTAATAWILPFTAGGFIYIATVSVMPELLEDTKPTQSLKEVVALLLGIYMMLLIAQYE